MLGLRCNVTDSGVSPAEFLYRTTVRIPGEFILLEEFTPDPQVFIEEFREHMRMIKPAPVEHKHKRKIFFHNNLSSCSHVFLRVGTSKKLLKYPYTGPHKIIDRISDRVFEIEVNGSKRRVLVENVKPLIRNTVSSDVSHPATCVPVVNKNSDSQLQVRLPLKTYVNKKNEVKFDLTRNSLN